MGDLIFTKLTEATGYFVGPTNIGLVRKAAEAWLVDSGNDKDAGRKLLRQLEAEGLRLRAVLNTHSNADHIGANAYLQAQTSCEIWAPAAEAPFVEFPLLEPSLLWGGFPPPGLRSKFFEAKASRVTRRLAPDGMAEGFRFLALPGHFLAMSGVLTEDGVFFLGDAVFGPEVLEKHKVPFLYDVAAFRESLKRIAATQAAWFVPSHGEPRQDPLAFVEANAAAADRVEAVILESIAGPASFEEILASLCARLGLELDLGRYALVGSTLRSFLAYLEAGGKARHRFEGGKMLWSA